jgi:hypothetical protein
MGRLMIRPEKDCFQILMIGSVEIKVERSMHATIPAEKGATKLSGCNGN